MKNLAESKPPGSIRPARVLGGLLVAGLLATGSLVLVFRSHDAPGGEANAYPPADVPVAMTRALRGGGVPAEPVHGYSIELARDRDGGAYAVAKPVVPGPGKPILYKRSTEWPWCDYHWHWGYRDRC